MGRYWASATPEQRAQVTEKFKLLLILTYSGALAQVHDQEITYQPFRASPEGYRCGRALVDHQQWIGGLSLGLIDSTRHLQGWRVYDINILGAWLIQVYKLNNLPIKIAQHGVDGLISFLTQRNQQLAAGG